MELWPIVGSSRPALHTPSDEASILQMPILPKHAKVQRRIQGADSADWRHVVVARFPASLYIFDFSFDGEKYRARICQAPFGSKAADRRRSPVAEMTSGH